jgi:hypothetical protein
LLNVKLLFECEGFGFNPGSALFLDIDHFGEVAATAAMSTLLRVPLALFQLYSPISTLKSAELTG